MGKSARPHFRVYARAAAMEACGLLQLLRPLLRRRNVCAWSCFRGAHPTCCYAGTEIAKTRKYVALLVWRSPASGVCAHPTAGKDLGAVLKRVLAAHRERGAAARIWRAKLADRGPLAAARNLRKALFRTTEIRTIEGHYACRQDDGATETFAQEGILI